MNQLKIEELLNSENIEEKIKELSYEEKCDIFDSKLYIVEILIDRLIENNIKLFNREESIEFSLNFDSFINSGDPKKRNIFFSKIALFDLPDEMLFEKYIQTNNSAFLKIVKNPLKLLEIENLSQENLIGIIPYLPDEVLEKMIRVKQYKDEMFFIIRCLDSDEKKMKYMNKLSLDEQFNIIATLSEENILKYLEKLKSKRGEIISLLKDEKKKEEFFTYYRSSMTDIEKAKIIASFDDTELINKYIGDLQTEKSLNEFVFNIRSSNPIIVSDLYRNIVLSLKNEETINFLFTSRKIPFNDVDLVKNLIQKINKQSYLYEILERRDLKSVYKYVLPKIHQSYIIKYVKEYMEYIGDYHILLYIENPNLLFKTLDHYKFDNDYNDDMLPLLQKIAKKYSLNLDHLVKLVKIVNCSILSQIRNENVQKAINLDEENFKKYLKLFDKKNIEGDLNRVLEVLLNKKFSVNYSNKVNIFIDTLHDVFYGRIDEAIFKIKEVLTHIDLKHYNIAPLQIINGILKNDQEIIKIYNKMTYDYLMLERNKYFKEEIDKTLFDITEPKYEVNGLVKYMLKIMPINNLLELIKGSYELELSPEERNLLNNKELLISLIKFKKNPNMGLKDENKKYLKLFNEILKKIFIHNNFDLCKFKMIEGLNIQYDIIPGNKRNIVEIMTAIDVDKIKELVFSDPEIYEELLKCLDLYDVLGWTEKFEKVAGQADIEMSPNVVGSLISNYSFIFNQKKEKISKGERFNFVSELALADCLDSDSSIYSILFGREDYRLLRRNPGPNSSHKSKKYRLDKALKYLKLMRSRKYITVPPVNKNFELSNGKKINIIIGNTNDTINLTYGERTGACMRIGGAGESLFDFCLKNENGFHISFNNPNTGELVSRVSCYRNGNTVFFNQVRYSLDPDYTNDMIQEAARLIGNEIIQNTKNSKYPVLNIVTTSSYAYYGAKTVNTHCPKPTRGFIPPFYTDIYEDVVVIATSSGDLAPIKLGPDKAEKYEIGRAPIRKFNEKNASRAISKIEALDQYFSNVSIDNIEINQKDVVVAYVGEDWYIAITADNRIINYIQKNSRDLKSAKEEMNKYLHEIEKVMSQSKLEEAIEDKVIK